MPSIITLCHNAECHYAERRVLLIFMPNVIMLSVVLLNVMAPANALGSFLKNPMIVSWHYMGGNQNTP
jgi:hypothetical protein